TAPLALIWLVLGYFKPSRELAEHTAALQGELSRLRDPLGDAEAQSLRIADALRQRLELVETATAAADDQLTRATRLLEGQSEAIGAAAAKVAGEVEQARESLSAQHEVLEEQSGAAVRLMREQVDEIERRIAEAGERLERQSAAFSAGAEAARRSLAEPVEVLAEFGE